jgi:SNF2 family DNA or RNA helicase
LSVVSNWEIQIKDHIRRKCLTYYIYHGSDRKQDLNELRDHDIIITSYHTIASEFKRQNSPLFSVHWFRVILDEAHIIRNPGTIMSAGACELAAERRWAVTGTPVQNRLDDLGSLIKFLRIKPFDEKGAFAQYILAPFKSADPHILPKLRLLVDSITLRRLKNNIDLPDRKDFIVRLDFSKEEKDIYTTFVADSRTKVRLLTGGDRLGGKTYAHILKAIMRLRLACAHGEELLSDDDRKLLEGLTKDKAIDLTDDDNDDAPKLSKKQAFEMLELLRQSDLDTCPRCNKRIENKVADDELSEDDEVRQDTDTIGHMTACYHIICPACFPKHEEEIEQLAQDDMMEKGTDGDVYTCPYCRQEGTKLAHYKILQSELDAEEAEKARIRANPKLAKRLGLYRGPHTKTLKLIEYLKKFEAESHENPSEEPIKRHVFVPNFCLLTDFWHSVVFSTWTNHLDLIQIALEANNIKYSRLDGSMSRKNRAAAIRTFTNDREITVILITVGAGGLGLNLTAANKVFVMEPQFNPQAEAQSVDRVHRLGQTREVEVIRLIMRDSFEENMLAQQKMKIDLADLAVNRNTKMDKAEAAKAKLESLRALFR